MKGRDAGRTMEMTTTRSTVLDGGGACGALLRAFDWTASPLGPPATWPPELRTLVGVMLGSRQPMFIVWGESLTTLYNDGYSVLCGNRHPAGLGGPFDALWHDIWSDIAPILQRAYAGQSTSMDDITLVMHRNGYPEETHFAFSYTSVRNEAGAVAGMFCACQETTAQVMAERAVRASAERQRRMFEQAPGFIATLRGPDHVFDFVNAAYARLFAPSRDLVGLSVRDAFPLLEAQGLLDRLDAVYRSGERFVAEQLPLTLAVVPGGEARTLVLDFIYEPIMDETGAITGIFVEGYDVTTRSQAETALRASEEELRVITDGLPMLISYVGRDQRYRFVNRYYEEWFGQPSASIVGQPLRDVVGEEAYEFRRPFIERALAGEHLSFDALMPRRAGEARECHIQYIPRLAPDGEVDGFYVMVLDISGRKAAERALRESEENYRFAAELSPQVAWTATPDGEIDRVAERWRTWTGREGLDGTWADALHPDDREASQRAWMAAVRTGEPFDFEDRVLLRSGEYRWMHSQAFPRRDTEGRIVKWYGTTEDVDAQRRATEALRDLNETLEERVLERTAELERVHEQLRHAQKIEALGQLTGGVAHDFNNLLMVVSGGLDLMEKQPEPARRTRLHGAMKEAVDRGARLTRQLLAFSRQQRLKPQVLALAERIDAMQELLARSLSGNVVIETRFPADLWPVEVDASELELVILNLAVNARDAMPDGGTIVIGAANVPAGAGEEGDFVRLFVSDSGGGIAPEIAVRVFEPFFTTKDIGKGSGLGLAQVYGFAVQSGGRADIETSPRGTTVNVWLPRVEPEKAIDSIPVPAPAGAGEPARGCVLLVEDDDEVGLLVQEMLASLGYQVTRARSGAAAIDLLAKRAAVDVILSDIMMPNDMSGVDMARAIRATSTVPIVLTSGYAEPFREAAAASGFTILDKPYRIEQLAEVLAQHFPGPS
jgi:PAS domain S-box-containing protein